MKPTIEVKINNLTRLALITQKANFHAKKLSQLLTEINDIKENLTVETKLTK